jgi:superfamily I DNA/RNA helicase
LIHAKGRIEVLDINQLALRCFERNNLPYLDSDDADEWGRMVVEELKSKIKQKLQDVSIDSYQTILVDEAQDMQAWQLELIKIHAGDQPTICIATGKGQELYSSINLSTGWISDFAKTTKIKTTELTRNFRNTNEQFLQP